MVSCANPCIAIHECKYKVDGVTKCVETHRFVVDHVFDENDDNDQVYRHTLAKYLDCVLQGGVLTCFAYGQTGSGKTYTMRGIESMAVQDLFKQLSSK